MPDPYHDLLEALASHLEGEGFESFVKLGGGTLPDQLYVALDPDAAGRQSHLQLMFLPGIEEVPILQTYVGLPYEIADGTFGALARFVLAANVTMPLGGFGVIADQRLCYFRYNAATPVDPFDVDVVTWSMSLASHVIDRVGPLVERVALGADPDETEVALIELIASEADQFEAVD